MNNPLSGLLPAKVRQVAYAVLFLGAQAFALYRVSNGDWAEFAGSEMTSLLGLLAASNVHDPALVPKPHPRAVVTKKAHVTHSEGTHTPKPKPRTK